MRRILLTTLTIWALAVVTCEAQGIPWTKDVAKAQQQAKTQRRLVLLHFWDHGCPPCQTLERRVLNRPEVIRSIGTNYVPVKINVSENRALAQKYKVNRWPTDVILDSTGREVFRAVSSQTPNYYVQTLDKVAAHVRAGHRVIQQSILHNSNSPSQGNGSPALAGNRDSAFPAGGSAQPLANRRPAGKTDPLGHQYDSRTAKPNPRYGQQQLPIKPHSVTNQFVPRSAPGLNLNDDRAGSNAPAQTGLPANLGLEGFCPVKLYGSRTEPSRWQKGDPRFGIFHRGKLYLFCCADCLQQFKADPDRFAPFLSGNDVVKYVERGQVVPGKRGHGLTYKGHIYLFADEESLQKFIERRAHYSEAARRSMRNGQR